MGDGMKRAMSSCVVAALLALGAAGCGGDDKQATAGGAKTTRTHTTAVDPAKQAKLMSTGAKVFAKNCNSCHAMLNRPRTAPTFELPPPSFNDVEPTLAYVKSRVTSGGIDMQSFSGELTPFQIDAVATYVTETAGRDVDDAAADAGSQLDAGEQVFAEHCTRCHGIAGEMRAGRPQWGGTDFNVVKPSSKWILHMLDIGVDQAMPKFGKRLPPDELRAVAQYVESVAGENPEVMPEEEPQ
jgi:mono/diheme cytochrome c family protein